MDAPAAKAAPGPVGIVTGLASEAKALRAAAGGRALCLGPGPQAAGRAARRLLDEGARALVSAGLCGALDPALAPGEVVLATRVVARTDPARSWMTDPVWHAAVAGRLPPELAFGTGALLGSDTAVVSVAGKQSLAGRTGAVAVDMESHAVAAVAAEAGVPFLVLRAVADTAADALPPWLAGVLNRDGTPNARVAARRLLAGPWRAVTLIRLARRGRAAERALGRAASELASAGDGGPAPSRAGPREV